MNELSEILEGTSLDVQMLNAIVEKASAMAKNQKKQGGVVAINNLSPHGSFIALKLGELSLDIEVGIPFKAAAEQTIALFGAGMRVRIGKYAVAFWGYDCDTDPQLNQAVAASIGAYLHVRDQGLDPTDGEEKYKAFHAAGIEAIEECIDRNKIKESDVIKELANSVFGVKR